MCDPITLAVLAAGTAASVGGGIISDREQVQNQRKITEARNKVLRQEQAKNQVISDAARAEFNKRIGDMAPENTQPQLAENQGERTDTIQSNIEGAPTAEALPTAAAQPKVVQTALGEKLAEVAAKGKDRAAALGKLGGFGDFFQDQAVRDEEAGRGVDTQMNFLRGNMGLLPTLQDYAEYQAYKPSSGLGEIISTLGQVAAQAAGSGAFKGAPAGGSSGFYNPGVGPKGMGFTHFGGPR